LQIYTDAHFDIDTIHIYIYIHTHFDTDKYTLTLTLAEGGGSEHGHDISHDFSFFKYTPTTLLYTRFFFNICTHLDIDTAEGGGSEGGHNIFLDKSPLEVPLGFRSLETESEQVDGSV